MYAIIFLPFIISFVHSQDNTPIPNPSDLPVFPGSVGNIGNLDERNGPPEGFGSLGIVPLTNIGSGPVGTIGQDNGPAGIRNLPKRDPQSTGGNVANLPLLGSLNTVGGVTNLLPGGAPNTVGGLTNLLPGGASNTVGGVTNLLPGGAPNIGGGVTNLPLGGGLNTVGGVANLLPGGAPNTGGVANLPSGGGINSGGGIGNLPPGGAPNNGQGGFNQNNGGGSAVTSPIIGSPIGILPSVPIISSSVVDVVDSVLLNIPNVGQILNGTDIVRPCQVFDIYCIRRYFKKNGKCKEVRGPIPEPYFRAQSTLQVQRINATFSAFNVLYEGLNGRINEFYINRRTDKLVISIEFRNVTFFSRDVYYRFYRRGREPITTYDYLYLNYKSYITTTIIPKIRDLQLYKSETTTFTNDAIPAFSIGPNAFSHPDPAVQLARIELLQGIPIFVQEAQLTEGPFSAATFIQNNICDFKLKVL